MTENPGNLNYKRSPFAGIIGFAIIVGIIYMLFLTVKGVWSILAFLAPILFIAALIVNRHVVFDYGKMLLNTIKTDTPRGIIYSVLSFIGFPLVSAFLFVKAMSLRKINQMTGRTGSSRMKEDKYDDYEEVVEDDEDFLELPELEIDKQASTKKTQSRNDYEDLFE